MPYPIASLAMSISELPDDEIRAALEGLGIAPGDDKEANVALLARALG